MVNPNELRKYKRVKENVNIKIDIVDSGKRSGKFEIAEAENLSASGVLLRYDKPLEIGQLINVSFMAPNSFDMIRSKAVVVRVEITPEKLWEIGVSFLEMEKEAEKSLDFYLTYT